MGIVFSIILIYMFGRVRINLFHAFYSNTDTRYVFMAAGNRGNPDMDTTQVL